MIAFTIFWRPIYRYGIFYLITFLFWYFFLRWLGKTQKFSIYPKVQWILTDWLDDMLLIALIGVIVGGRLGHVFLYDWWYYRQHLGEIIQIRQGGMSFVGGFLGVLVGGLIFARIKKVPVKEIFLMADIILCIVPLWILLWRIGNYLNQELWGKPLIEISSKSTEILKSLHLTRVYDQVDSLERVNTNFIQAGAEGLFLLLISWSVMFWQYLRWKIHPGLITWLFLMGYGTVRFFVEFLKDLPSQEMRWVLSVSQWIMIFTFGFGIWIIERKQKSV